MNKFYVGKAKERKLYKQTLESTTLRQLAFLLKAYNIENKIIDYDNYFILLF